MSAYTTALLKMTTVEPQKSTVVTYVGGVSGQVISQSQTTLNSDNTWTTLRGKLKTLRD